MVARDQWAEWLLGRSFGNDPEVRTQSLEELGEVREKVLDNARLAEGETLLDVGCGDGLIGFGALDRGAGVVVFSDISTDLLDTCRATARDLGVVGRCSFLLASATKLGEIADSSVDVVTTRSVLIYVREKEQALREFHRVLRSGGRLSLFEPINRLSNFLTAYDVAPVQVLADRVRAVFKRIQPPQSDPMLDFDERDLVDLADRAGFQEVYLQLELKVKPPQPRKWETFLSTAGNPKLPTYGEAMEQALTREEQERLSSQLRPLVEEGHGRARIAVAYLYAKKNGDSTRVQP
jgi:arsenite methyltransferase